MKKLLLSIVMAVFCLCSNAEIKRDNNTFRVEQSQVVDTKTQFIWADKDGVEYPIFMSKKGACYIFRTSKKSGKEYKYYLPKEVQEEIRKELNKSVK